MKRWKWFVLLVAFIIKLGGVAISFASPDDFGFPRLGDIKSLDSSSHDDPYDDNDDPDDDHDDPDDDHDDSDDDHDDIDDDFDDMDDHD